MRFLFVDQILDSVPGVLIRGIKHITPDDPFLSAGEDGRCYFTPSLIGETLGQLAAWNVMQSLDFAQRPVAGVVARATVHRPAFVGETLLLESFIDSLDESAVRYHSVARVHDEVVFTIDNALGPLLPMADFIDPDEVRRQFNEINRPGEWPPKSLPSTSPLHSPVCPPSVSFQFDELLRSEPGVELSAYKRISRAAPYFPDHFPRKPVLPLTVLLECQLNLAREFLRQMNALDAYAMNDLRRIKMSDFVRPGDVVMTHCSVKQRDESVLVLHFRSEVDGKRVCVMDLLLTPLPRIV